MSLYALVSVAFALLVGALREHGMTLTEAVDAVHEQFLPGPTPEEVEAAEAEAARLRSIERGRAERATMMAVAQMQGGMIS